MWGWKNRKNHRLWAGQNCSLPYPTNLKLRDRTATRKGGVNHWTGTETKPLGWNVCGNPCKTLLTPGVRSSSSLLHSPRRLKNVLISVGLLEEDWSERAFLFYKSPPSPRLRKTGPPSLKPRRTRPAFFKTEKLKKDEAGKWDQQKKSHFRGTFCMNLLN